MKNIKNKRALLFGGVLCLAFAAIAITIAYNQDRSILANNFGTSVYKTVTTEEFVGPDNWAPCQEVPKTVTVKNEGNVDVAVRISYEEYWRGSDGIDLSSQRDGVNLVNIVFQNENDWELRPDGYYYYKDTLAPGEETTSLFEKVVLSCDANTAIDNVCAETETGTVCDKPVNMPGMNCTTNLGGEMECVTFHTYDDYNGANYHLRIKAETIQADASDYWHNLHGIVADQAKNLPAGYEVDYTKNAKTTDTGVLKASEKGREIYYYRGKVNDNNVVWADMCWQIVRTTYSGGIKMIFNGLPTTITQDGRTLKQCLATGADKLISYSGIKNFKYNSGGDYLAFSNYMYGDTGDVLRLSGNSVSYVFSKSISYDDGTYTLDTSAGQSVTAQLGEANRYKDDYHYFCIDGSSSCGESEAGYILWYSEPYSPDPYVIEVGYVLLGGYGNFSQLRTAVDANTNSSTLKTITENWFVDNGLGSHEDELEDAIYCNDRRYDNALGSDSSSLVLYTIDSLWPEWGKSTAFASLENPDLYCAKNDSFTVSDSVNGNARLAHKVGHITSSEEVLAGNFYSSGIASWDLDSNSYLANGVNFYWTMTPYDYGKAFDAGRFLSGSDSTRTSGIRPVVSLKKGVQFVRGAGTASDPYIVE